MKKLIILFLFTMMMTPLIFAQEMMLEKDYEISRKAKKGYLGNVESLENGNFNMIFILQ